MAVSTGAPSVAIANGVRFPRNAQEDAEAERRLRAFVADLDEMNSRPLSASEPEAKYCTTEGLRPLKVSGDLKFDGLTPAFYEEGATCEKFIRSDGSYGAVGEIIARELKNTPRLANALISDKAAQLPSMKELCPGFASADKETRIHIMVWVMASIGWTESKCGALTKNTDNPEAVGLFQMEKSKASRYWRGPYCDVKSVMDDENNTKCTLEVLRGQFEGLHGPAGLYPYSYFLKLKAIYLNKQEKNGVNKLDTEILSRAKAHPLCRGGVRL